MEVIYKKKFKIIIKIFIVYYGVFFFFLSFLFVFFLVVDRLLFLIRLLLLIISFFDFRLTFMFNDFSEYLFMMFFRDFLKERFFEWDRINFVLFLLFESDFFINLLGVLLGFDDFRNDDDLFLDMFDFFRIGDFEDFESVLLRLIFIFLF